MNTNYRRVGIVLFVLFILSKMNGRQRLELAPLDEEVEERRVCLQPAVLDAPNERLQLAPLRHREQRDARTLDRRVAHLHHLLVGQIRHEPDAASRVEREMTAEAAGEVED